MIVAFEQRWFGNKSLSGVRTILRNFSDRFDAYPIALKVLQQWCPSELTTRQNICHWHLQLSDPIYRQFSGVYLEQRRAIAQQASQIAQGQKSLFSCQSRSLAEKIAEQMQHKGIDVFVHHSSVSAEERTTAEERFHQGDNTSIVCTSTLELGIDVSDLDLVLQANAPSTVSSFLQRLGRTGRRKGQRANTTFFCEDTETVLQAIALIEMAKKGWVESVPTNNRVWLVLVHQILALTLQFGAISVEKCWQQLSAVPDFSGINRSEFEHLIAYMVRENFMYLSEGLFSIGDQTEKTFGRRNFMEIYAVFNSPQLYKVTTEAGYVIGLLEQNFVDKLVEEMSSFLLSGKAWVVNYINHEDRTVKIIPAPRGKQPTWGGFIPQLLGFEVCQQIKELLSRRDRLLYIDRKSQSSLDEWRQELNSVLGCSGLCIFVEEERVLWWTFAGGQINHTLKYGIQVTKDWKIVALGKYMLPETVKGQKLLDGIIDVVEFKMAILCFQSHWLPNGRTSVDSALPIPSIVVM